MGRPRLNITDEERKERARISRRKWKKANPDKVEEHDRKRRERNRERINARARAWRMANREHCLVIQRKSNGKNRTIINLRKREKRKANPEHARAEYRRERARNPERARASTQRWRRNNAEAIRLYNRAYLEDIEHKLAKAIRNRVRSAVQYQSGRRSAGIYKILGCDLDWLMAWLEVQFRPSMTWDNYGPAWHIDHIRPCASFDLTDPRQQRLCFHWTNLQPLLAEENFRKNKFYKAA